MHSDTEREREGERGTADKEIFLLLSFQKYIMARPGPSYKPESESPMWMAGSILELSTFAS